MEDKKCYVACYEFEPAIDNKNKGVFTGNQDKQKYSEQYVEERVRKDVTEKYEQQLRSFKMLWVKFFDTEFEMGIFIGNAEL